VTEWLSRLDSDSVGAAFGQLFAMGAAGIFCLIQRRHVITDLEAKSQCRHYFSHRGEDAPLRRAREVQAQYAASRLFNHD